MCATHIVTALSVFALLKVCTITCKAFHFFLHFLTSSLFYYLNTYVIYILYFIFIFVDFYIDIVDLLLSADLPSPLMALAVDSVVQVIGFSYLFSF